jgi:c(7)-type cytochrome triheme protein
MKWIAACTRVVLLIFAFAGVTTSRPLSTPQEYGKVILRTASDQSRLAPVQFDHWLHRAYYTCRLCHVDVGFAMEANATQVSADSNIKGYYCGSCHDGKKTLGGKRIFASCSPGGPLEESARCNRCHSVGKTINKEYDYGSFTRKLPRLQAGLIDWEQAEDRGLIRPLDLLPGLSVQRPAFSAQKDFQISSRGSWMPNILFSHKKHALWNGCEVCHPDIFPSVKKGTVKYSMFQISGGQYCGLCHNTVAFPINECQKCHVHPVHKP